MKKGIIMVVCGIVIGLCSMGVWIIDNSLFEIMGLGAMGCMLLMMLGFIVYLIETITPDKR